VRAPTGDQYHLTLDADGRAVSAVVTEVAAGIRALEVGGTALVESFPEGSAPPGAAGIVLVPWPNRVRDGLWHLDGVPQQLDISEPKFGNASHGLLRFTGYRLLEQHSARVLQGAAVFPQHGYPFLLATTVEHRLVPDGMVVTHTVTNCSADPAPVAVGAHPYLRVGEVPAEELTFVVDADTRLVTDDQKIPVGQQPVDGTPFDLRAGRVVGELDIDDGYTGLGVTDGRSRHSLTAPDGRRVELWADSDFGWVQAFTPTAFAAPEGPRRAVALEPMTAPADALNSGAGLRWLEPDETWTLSWGIRLAVG
jgi:aldose 1-epimerase